MDPLSVAASIAGIFAVIGKSVSTLNSIRIQFQDADLRLELLEGQLQTVRAALYQVKLLVTESLIRERQHQQLVADLAEAVRYCKLLVQHIDHQISKMHQPGYSLKLENRVLLVLEDKAIEEYLTRLDHQLSAINLLITAFRCRTPGEQKQLLDKAESRSILEQAADVASSIGDANDSPLNVVARPASVMSNKSRVSRLFTFDDLLAQHDIYKRSFKSMLRRASAPAREDEAPRSTSPTSMTALELRDSCERSARLDSMLKADAQKKRRELKILCLGHSRSTLVKHLRTQKGHQFQDVDLQHYRVSIVGSLVWALLEIVDDVETRGAGFATEQARRHTQLLREFSQSASPAWQVSDEVSSAARALWRNWLVQQSFQQMNQDRTSSYFLESTDRILAPKYQPTMSDVIRAPERLQTVRETRLAIDDLNADLIEVPHGRLARVIHQFDHVDACLLSLDLTSYDRYSEDDKGRNTLEQGISLFKSICRSFETKPIMLVCVNFSAFRKKLKTSPLSIHFSDFKADGDPSAAANFILRRCKRMVGGDQDLFHHFAEHDAEDPSTIRFLESKIAGLPNREYMIRMLGLQSSSAIRGSDQPRPRAATKKTLVLRSQSTVSV